MLKGLYMIIVLCQGTHRPSYKGIRSTQQPKISRRSRNILVCRLTSSSYFFFNLVYLSCDKRLLNFSVVLIWQSHEIFFPIFSSGKGVTCVQSSVNICLIWVSDCEILYSQEKFSVFLLDSETQDMEYIFCSGFTKIVCTPEKPLETCCCLKLSDYHFVASCQGGPSDIQKDGHCIL